MVSSSPITDTEISSMPAATIGVRIMMAPSNTNKSTGSSTVLGSSSGLFATGLVSRSASSASVGIKKVLRNIDIL